MKIVCDEANIIRSKGTMLLHAGNSSGKLFNKFKDDIKTFLHIRYSMFVIIDPKGEGGEGLRESMFFLCNNRVIYNGVIYCINIYICEEKG